MQHHAAEQLQLSKYSKKKKKACWAENVGIPLTVKIPHHVDCISESVGFIHILLYLGL